MQSGILDNYVCIYNIIFIYGVLKCLFVVLKLCLQTLAKKQDIFRISV